MSHQSSLLAPGTKVYREDGGRREYGYIIYGYWLEELECYDYYVAFVGYRGFPNKAPTKPYVLRYLDSSLHVYES